MARASASSRDQQQAKRYSRFFGAIERLVAHFQPSSVDGFLIPDSPVPLDNVINAFFDPDESDPVEFWQEAPTDSILFMGWEGSMGAGTFSIDAISLASRRRVYVSHAEDLGLHVIASTAPTFVPDDVDLRFLQQIARDNGAAFGGSLIGSCAPAQFGIGGPLDDKGKVDLTLALLQVSGTMDDLRNEDDYWWEPEPERPQPPMPAWEKKIREEFGPARGFAAGMGLQAKIREYIRKHKITLPPQPEDDWPEEGPEPTDREVVEAWLRVNGVISARPKE